jgi:hypothetical protein
VTIHDVNLQQQQAELFFQQLFHQLAAEERVEVRTKLPGEDQPMRRAFYADPKVAARYAIGLGRDHEVYAGAAPRLGKDGSKAGVSRLWALWADLDKKDGYTRESRFKQLLELPHHPSILVWTGGGLHAYWLLRESAEGLDELNHAERIMRQVAKGLGGDPVHDRSRIMRVPGTQNFKFGEPRPVVMEHYNPDLRYGLEDLKEMAEALPRKANDDSDKGGAVQRDVLSGPIRKGQRNVALASVAGSLRNRGLEAETICRVLLEVNRLRCEPPLADSEVISVVQSISRYPAGSARYLGSPARRVRCDEEASR